MHYLEYRETHDVDAWWLDTATTEDERTVIETLEAVLSRTGTVRIRRWGDVVSVELQQDRRTVFSFQLARPSARLEPPRPAPWIAVQLDGFKDLVASKMVALVERGAPRDFRDVYAVCSAGLIAPDTCWTLWRARQQLAGSEPDPERARLALESHLTRIALHRPLEQIPDADQRLEAATVRTWFRTEFIDALL